MGMDEEMKTKVVGLKRGAYVDEFEFPELVADYIEETLNAVEKLNLPWEVKLLVVMARLDERIYDLSMDIAEREAEIGGGYYGDDISDVLRYNRLDEMEIQMLGEALGILMKYYQHWGLDERLLELLRGFEKRAEKAKGGWKTIES